MTEKTRQTEWSHKVRQALRNFRSAGIREAPSTTLFQWCEHVTICVDGLVGVGVIHQSDVDEPFRLCVFEPSVRESEGLAEIFERSLDSLEELPQRIEEWRSFRSRTDNP